MNPLIYRSLFYHIERISKDLMRGLEVPRLHNKPAQ